MTDQWSIVFLIIYSLIPTRWCLLFGFEECVPEEYIQPSISNELSALGALDSLYYFALVKNNGWFGIKLPFELKYKR